MNETDRAAFYEADEELNAYLLEVEQEDFADALEVVYLNDPLEGARMLATAPGFIRKYRGEEQRVKAAGGLLRRVYGQ